MKLLMMRVLLNFPLKLNSHHPCTFASSLQQTPKQKPIFAQLLQYSQKMLKLLAFKCFLNDILLERKFSEVMLIWLFVSIKSITSFSIFFFFFLKIPILILASLGNCPFSIYRHHDHKLKILKLKFHSEL